MIVSNCNVVYFYCPWEIGGELKLGKIVTRTYLAVFNSPSTFELNMALTTTNP